MADLLLHSMAEFRELIVTALEVAGARRVVEVGAEHGAMTDALIASVKKWGGTLTSIDPAPSPEVEALFSKDAPARLLKRRSLEALPDLAADAYLIDGDHNYFTVLNESRIVWERSRACGTPLLVFYHDVCWPWARRDLYYDPLSIPEAYRQPYTWDLGVTLDQPGVIQGGFRGQGVWACALREGGPRNGVLTAIEDFVVGKEAHLLWARIPAVFGLGVLFERTASWSEMLQQLLLPYHESGLLARLERNRLENYLRVIEWQDRADAQCA